VCHHMMIVILFPVDKAQYFAAFKGSNELDIKIGTEKCSISQTGMESSYAAAVTSSFDALQFNNRFEKLYNTRLINITNFYCMMHCVQEELLLSSLWSPYGIGQTYYIFMLWFLLSSFFSLPNLSRCRLDVCHTSTHGVALVQI